MSSDNSQTNPVVRAVLDVSPSWWSKIHHRRNGAFRMTVTELVKQLEIAGIEPLAIHATEERLTVVIAGESSDSLSMYEEKADALRDCLMREISVDSGDYREKPDAPVDAEPQHRTTRGELELLLREHGYVPASETGRTDIEASLAELDPAAKLQPDDKDIWALPGTAARCVQFDERDGDEDRGKARWMDRNGEVTISYDQIRKRLSKAAADDGKGAGVLTAPATPTL